MLTAIKDNQTIFIYQHSPSVLKEWSNSKQLLCPDCKDVLTFKECSQKQNHFAHVSRDCSFPFREPESVEHEKGKMFIYNWLVEQFDKDDCEVEKHIQLTNQRSDTFHLSSNSAVEFQCSPIQSSTWLRRHALYQDANVTDFWILGYSMHKYQNKNNPFVHKLNQLEQTLLKEYGRLFYLDVLSDYFVVIQPHFQNQNVLYGQEFFFKSSECIFNTKEKKMEIKYDYFINMQQSRHQHIEKLTIKAKETDNFLKETKTKSSGQKVLASKRQVKFIQHLLTKRKMTIPYKLHGLLKHEATTIIKDLLSEEQKKETPKL